MDLDAYFRRIGYDGSRAPTLAALRALHERHPQALAFENLDPLLGRLVRLDLPSLEEKLVRAGRGGYCFEHNLLFSRVLETLGFTVTGLAARVLWNAPEDAITPRSHMLLRIEIEGRTWIADVGFGGQTLTAPLQLEPDVEQSTPHELYRITQLDDGFKLQSRIAGAWKTLYRFDLQHQFHIDYEAMNYYLSTAPESRFRSGIYIARPAQGRRFALFNDQLSTHHLDAASERVTLAGVADVRRTLEEVFLLKLPTDPALDTTLAQFLPDTAQR